MSEPKYLIVFPDCLVAPGCKTVGTWTLVAQPDIEAPGRFALTKQVDAATLARLIYTSRLWRFWTVIANYGGGIAGEDEALAVSGVELTHEKSF